MLNSPLVDAVIGILLVLMVFSSLVSIIVEYINNLGWRQKRQMYLYLSVRHALNEKDGLSWGTLLYKHPTIQSLRTKSGRYPAYISSETFAETLVTVLKEHINIGVITFDPLTNTFLLRKTDKAPSEIPPNRPLERMASAQDNEYELLKDFIDSKISDGQLKRLMSPFLMVSGEEKEKIIALTKNIARWFDDYQDTVIGEYKRSIRRDLRWVGISAALLFNVNTITIVKELLSNGELRSSLVSQAEKSIQDSIYTTSDMYCSDCSIEEFDKKYQSFLSSRLEQADSMFGWFGTSGLPMGWEKPPSRKQIRTDYLRWETKKLNLKKIDTAANLLRGYCLIWTFLDPETDVSNLHKVTTVVFQEPFLLVDQFDSLVRVYNVSSDTSMYDELQFFRQRIQDSLALAECLPSSAMTNRYKGCLNDCPTIELAEFQHNVIQQLDDRIRNNQLEIKIYDDLFAQAGVVSQIIQALRFPIEVVKHNIRTGKDLLLFILGCTITGLLATVSATTWFELLVRIFQVRNAGARPKKLKEDHG